MTPPARKRRTASSIRESVMNVRAVFALAAVLASSSALPLGAATDPLETAAQRYVAELEVRQPLFADGIGIHTQDDRLPDMSAAGLAANRVWQQSWRTTFAGLAASVTTADARADASAMLDRIDRELFEDDALHPYQTARADIHPLLAAPLTR